MYPGLVVFKYQVQWSKTCQEKVEPTLNEQWIKTLLEHLRRLFDFEEICGVWGKGGDPKKPDLLYINGGSVLF